jgi:hypothetical protein
MEVANLNLSKSFNLNNNDYYNELANIIKIYRLTFPAALSFSGHWDVSSWIFR